MIVIRSLFVQFLDCLVIQSTLPGLPLVTKIVASSGGIGGISLGAPEHLRRAPSINFPSTPAQGETDIRTESFQTKECLEKRLAL